MTHNAASTDAGWGRRLARVATLAAVLFAASIDSAAADSKFVVIGHLYPVANRPARIDRLIEQINAERPDYVFFLGDCYAWHPEFRRRLDAIEAELYFAPGNHDFEDRGRLYRQQVGYLETVVDTPDATFVIINTSESLEHIEAFLKAKLPPPGASKPVILMGHHHIWDDTKLATETYSHEKAFLFTDLYPTIRGRVDYIFSGDDNVRYFGDGEAHTNKGYFTARFGDIVCYACGMGGGVPKTNYAIAEIRGSKVVVEPRTVTVDRAQDVVVVDNPYITTPLLLDKVINLPRSGRFWIGAIAGFAASLLLHLTLRRRA